MLHPPSAATPKKLVLTAAQRRLARNINGTLRGQRHPYPLGVYVTIGKALLAVKRQQKPKPGRQAKYLDRGFIAGLAQATGWGTRPLWLCMEMAGNDTLLGEIKLLEKHTLPLSVSRDIHQVTNAKPQAMDAIKRHLERQGRDGLPDLIVKLRGGQTRKRSAAAEWIVVDQVTGRVLVRQCVPKGKADALVVTRKNAVAVAVPRSA